MCASPPPTTAPRPRLRRTVGAATRATRWRGTAAAASAWTPPSRASTPGHSKQTTSWTGQSRSCNRPGPGRAHQRCRPCFAQSYTRPHGAREARCVPVRTAAHATSPTRLHDPQPTPPLPTPPQTAPRRRLSTGPAASPAPCTNQRTCQAAQPGEEGGRRHGYHHQAIFALAAEGSSVPTLGDLSTPARQPWGGSPDGPHHHSGHDEQAHSVLRMAGTQVAMFKTCRNARNMRAHASNHARACGRPPARLTFWK